MYMLLSWEHYLSPSLLPLPNSYQSFPNQKHIIVSSGRYNDGISSVRDVRIMYYWSVEYNSLFYIIHLLVIVITKFHPH